MRGDTDYSGSCVVIKICSLSVKRISGVSWGSPQQVSAVAKITLLCDELSSRQKYLAKLSIKSPVADLWLVYKCALVAVLEL